MIRKLPASPTAQPSPPQLEVVEEQESVEEELLDAASSIKAWMSLKKQNRCSRRRVQVANRAFRCGEGPLHPSRKRPPRAPIGRVPPTGSGGSLTDAK